MFNFSESSAKSSYTGVFDHKITSMKMTCMLSLSVLESSKKFKAIRYVDHSIWSTFSLNLPIIFIGVAIKLPSFEIVQMSQRRGACYALSLLAILLLLVRCSNRSEHIWIVNAWSFARLSASLSQVNQLNITCGGLCLGYEPGGVL